MLEVTSPALPGARTHDGACFPLAFVCRTERAALGDALGWVRARSAELTARAAEHGALLFRGFPVRTAEDFDAFVAAFERPCFRYEESFSNAVRVNYTPRVFSANEAPPDVDINLHHEMAQTPLHPRRLFFFCDVAAEQGGATSLCRSDVLLHQLRERRPDFVRACRDRGLRYTHTMPAEEDARSGMGRSWRSTFSVESREAAEARMRELGYEWTWLDGGALRATTPRLPAVRELDDGRTTFFNQLIAAFTGWKDSRNDPTSAVTFGDGSPLDVEGARLAAELAEQLTFDVAWQRGDVALVDNHVAMHGRRTFRGQRRILACFVDPTPAQGTAPGR